MSVTIKDITTYNRYDNERKPRVIEISTSGTPGLKYKVHRHIHYSDTWFLSCNELGIENEDMKTDSLHEALHNARIFMLGAIEGYIARLMIAEKELEESED